MELWFNDDDCEEDNGEAGVSEALGGHGLGEPDKADPVIGSCADKQADKMDVVAETVGPVVPTIDKVMEEDKKKELLKAGGQDGRGGGDCRARGPHHRQGHGGGQEEGVTESRWTRWTWWRRLSGPWSPPSTRSWRRTRRR